MEEFSVIRPFGQSTPGPAKPPAVPSRLPKLGGSETKVAGLPGAGGESVGATSQSPKSVSSAEVKAAVEDLNLQLEIANRTLRFQIDETIKEIKVLVINEETGEVVRTIPPEASIRLAANGQPRGLFTVQG